VVSVFVEKNNEFEKNKVLANSDNSNGIFLDVPRNLQNEDNHP